MKTSTVMIQIKTISKHSRFMVMTMTRHTESNAVTAQFRKIMRELVWESNVKVDWKRVILMKCATVRWPKELCYDVNGEQKTRHTKITKNVNTHPNVTADFIYTRLNYKLKVHVTRFSSILHYHQNEATQDLLKFYLASYHIRGQ